MLVHNFILPLYAIVIAHRYLVLCWHLTAFHTVSKYRASWGNSKKDTRLCDAVVASFMLASYINMHCLRVWDPFPPKCMHRKLYNIFHFIQSGFQKIIFVPYWWILKPIHGPSGVYGTQVKNMCLKCYRSGWFQTISPLSFFVLLLLKNQEW